MFDRNETTDDLFRYVLDRLPVRARLVGKDRLKDMVALAVAEWPIQPLMDCERGSASEQKILDYTAQRVGFSATRNQEKQYGFIWTLILSGVLSAMVQAILRWWLSRPSNRVKMAAWQYGMRGGS